MGWNEGKIVIVNIAFCVITFRVTEFYYVYFVSKAIIFCVNMFITFCVKTEKYLLL